MHAIFIVSVLVQITLAAHAYHRGRTRPWVWIILFFPFVGSLLYAFLFLLPSMRSGGRPAPLTLRRVPRGPFANAGDRPDNAVVVSSLAEIAPSVHREDCPQCGDPLGVDDEHDDTIAGRDLRVVVARCPRCEITPVRYFEVLAS